MKTKQPELNKITALYERLSRDDDPDLWIIDEEAAAVVRRIYQLIIEGNGPMQEAIVDEETWLTVQKIRETKHRPSKKGDINPLTGLVYCADCGAKMFNHRTNQSLSKRFAVPKNSNRKAKQRH